jgi:hypothetical protein
MTPDSDGPRRYSDEEVRKLLERASELERKGTTLPARADGPTLSDLEAIASEAGINAAAIRQAARELDSASGLVEAESPISRGVLGAPLALELERVVYGEVPDSVLERLIPSIQRASDGVGQPSLFGRTLTWQSTDANKARTLNLTVSVGRGEIRLVVEERYGNLAGGLFGGLIAGIGGGVGLPVGLGVGLGALGSALFATVFPVAIIGGSFALARSIYSNFVKRRIKTLRRLMDELVAIVEEGVDPDHPRLGAGS